MKEVLGEGEKGVSLKLDSCIYVNEFDLSAG